MKQPSSEPVFRYQEIPENRLSSKGTINWSREDLMVMVTFSLIIIATIVWVHSLAHNWTLATFAGLPVMIIAVALISKWRDSYGRVYREIYCGLYGLIVTMGIKKGILWIADDNGSRLARWLRGRKQAIPLQLGQVGPMEVDGEMKRVSVLNQTDGPYVHLPILADGGAFAVVDQDRQMRLVDRLATITNRIITQSDLKCGISYLYIPGPSDGSAFTNYIRVAGDPVVAQPDKFELDKGAREFAQWLKEDAEQLHTVMRKLGTARNWMVIMVTIRRDHQWKLARKGKLTDEELNDLSIIELGRDLVNDLSADAELELANVRVPGLVELSQMVRCSWDVVGIAQYYTALNQGLIPHTDEEVDEIRAQYSDNPDAAAKAVNAALRCWPEKIVEIQPSGKCIRLDDNYIQMMRITRLPEQCRADQYLALHSMPRMNQWLRQSMVAQAVSGKTESMSLIYSASLMTNAYNALYSNRVIENKGSWWHRRSREKQRQAEQLSANSVAQHFNQLYAGVGASEREVTKLNKSYRSSLTASGFSAKVIPGPENQMNGLISACLAANRL